MRRVHVLHIPKTGGLTLHRALQQAGIAATRSHDPAVAKAQAHAALIVSVLREPADRIVSLYRYMVGRGEFASSLCEFCAQHQPPEWWWGVNDVQARMVRAETVIGTLDSLNELINLVCAMVDVSAPDRYESYNVSAGSYTPTDDEYTAINAVTENDRALWEAINA